MKASLIHWSGWNNGIKDICFNIIFHKYCLDTVLKSWLNTQFPFSGHLLKPHSSYLPYQIPTSQAIILPTTPTICSPHSHARYGTARNSLHVLESMKLASLQRSLKNLINPNILAIHKLLYVVSGLLVPCPRWQSSMWPHMAAFSYFELQGIKSSAFHLSWHQCHVLASQESIS